MMMTLCTISDDTSLVFRKKVNLQILNISTQIFMMDLILCKSLGD